MAILVDLGTDDDNDDGKTGCGGAPEEEEEDEDEVYFGELSVKETVKRVESIKAQAALTTVVHTNAELVAALPEDLAPTVASCCAATHRLQQQASAASFRQALRSALGESSGVADEVILAPSSDEPHAALHPTAGEVPAGTADAVDSTTGACTTAPLKELVVKADAGGGAISGTWSVPVAMLIDLDTPPPPPLPTTASNAPLQSEGAAECQANAEHKSDAAAVETKGEGDGSDENEKGEGVGKEEDEDEEEEEEEEDYDSDDDDVLMALQAQCASPGAPLIANRIASTVISTPPPTTTATTTTTAVEMATPTMGPAALAPTVTARGAYGAVAEFEQWSSPRSPAMLVDALPTTAPIADCDDEERNAAEAISSGRTSPRSPATLDIEAGCDHDERDAAEAISSGRTSPRSPATLDIEAGCDDERDATDPRDTTGVCAVQSFVSRIAQPSTVRDQTVHQKLIAAIPCFAHSHARVL
jgi:hypothetical protein